MEKTELDEVVRLHRMWFHVENGGKRANLRGAYLSGAYLIGCDLRDANLRDANLSGSNTGEARFIQASGVGTNRRMTTFRSDTDEVWCGCFNGTLSEFAEKIEQTHSGNAVHLAHYRAMVAFFRVFAEVK